MKIFQLKDENGNSHYQSRYAKDFNQPEDLSCKVFDKHGAKTKNTAFTNFTEKNAQTSAFESFGSQLTTYRLAVATTAEYYNDIVENTDSDAEPNEIVLNELNILLNEVNALYLIDLSVRFELVENNDAILFDDPETDGYSNSSSEDLPINQTNLDEIIGTENYDIGHVIGYYGGGLAYVGVPCSPAFKAQGASVANFGVLAHELGHMMNSRHTFNGTEGFCSGNIGYPYEPGSGSTIMSYFGNCSSQNLSGPGDKTFHVGSQRFIRSEIESDLTCGTFSDNSNQAPTSNAGADYTIPANTPFVLTGTASDSDGDTLSHMWEQLELDGTSSTSSTMSKDDGKRALFRTIEPVARTERYFPKYETVLTGDFELGEALPSTTRELNFTFTVRDGNGGVATDTAVISSIANSKGFSLQNWSLNLQQPFIVQWNTGKSEQEAINCPYINISISNDNGITFSEFAFDVENDGIHTFGNSFNWPEGDDYLLKIECPDNIFYAISPMAVSIINEPMDDDLDNDGIPDAIERYYNLDPNSNEDMTLDSDGDGLSNSEEVYLGTNPLLSDSDHDGTDDLDELLQETDPTDILSRRSEITISEGFEDNTRDLNEVTIEWESTDAVAFEGDSSFTSTNTDNSSISDYVISFSATSSATLAFHYKVSSESNFDYLRLYINNELIEQWSGEVQWERYETSVGQGEYEVKWQYSKDGSVANGDDKAWIDLIELQAVQEVSRPAGDISEVNESFESGVPENWIQENTFNWLQDTSTGVEDNLSISSAEISDEETSSISLSEYFAEGTMSFYFKVSSESNWDYLNFYIDDSLQVQWSGELDWQEYSFDIEEGQHTLTWQYSKDGSISNGDDKAWIDNIVYRAARENLADGTPGDFDADAVPELLVRQVASAVTSYFGSGTQEQEVAEFGRSTDIPIVGDFDGDGYSDFAIRRPSTQYWYVRNSSGLDIVTGSDDGITRKRFGTQSTDIPVPSDYDGDGITDIAVRRPSNGFWYILNSSGRDLITGNDDGITRKRFGLRSEDIPVPADFDGDGQVDIAVRRPSTKTWYILNSSGVDSMTGNNDGISRVRFGTRNEDIPVSGDFDGDGKADLAVRRASTRYFYIKNSSGVDAITNNTDGITRLRFGRSEDIPITGDFDSDGQQDLGLYRPDSGEWFIKVSSGNSRTSSDDIERFTYGDADSIPLLAPIAEVMARLEQLN
ncbi:reprolysin-like metallopeptidase [Planctobacterium marinum]|uniref:Peptidase M12B domain-containing protein n=1 Tax=Planctobacterium marinum TaxID=1631968 RepID=A0AA48HNB7_9ALTE|nr:hypothetical protein MACH26_21730 [Planctobacterium marinum]